MNSLQRFHPLFLLTYYALTIGLASYMMHPLVLAFALVMTVLHVALLTSFMQAIKDVLYYGIYGSLLAIMYSAFSHNGITPLFFYNDNAITKEAIVYGAMLGMLLVLLVFCWQSLLLTMQTNHFLFLFTRLHPKVALVFIMVFRFIPYIREHWQQHVLAQKGGHYFETTSRFDRMGRYATLQFHTLMQAIDSVIWKPTVMNSKGYAKQRTQFQLFRWHVRDTVIVIVTLGAAAMALYSVPSFRYYPATDSLTLPPHAFIAIIILYALPVVLEGKEQLSWYYAKSNM